MVIIPTFAINIRMKNMKTRAIFFFSTHEFTRRSFRFLLIRLLLVFTKLVTIQKNVGISHNSNQCALRSINQTNEVVLIELVDGQKRVLNNMFRILNDIGLEMGEDHRRRVKYVDNVIT